MVRNRIKERLSDAGISAKALSEKMPDGLNPVAMTFIMAGKVLPTREGLQAMCSVLDCAVSDLYDLNDLNLLTESCPHTNGDDVPAGRRDAKEEFRSWMLPEEDGSDGRINDPELAARIQKEVTEMIQSAQRVKSLIGNTD